MIASSQNIAGSARQQFTTDEMMRRGVYGEQVFDGFLHRCGVCGEGIAFTHSVRIRQDIHSTPRCFECASENGTGSTA